MKRKSTCNPNIHHRRSIRLKEYDYSQVGLYLITLCCQDRIHLFGEVVNGEMILNELGQIAHDEWLKTLQVRDNINLHEFIVMPNHFHAIIEIIFQKGNNQENIGQFKSPSQTIGSIIRGYKIATTKKIKDFISSTGELQLAQNSEAFNFSPNAKKIWQRDYHEHIIRDDRAYQNISNYIINNPSKWKEDTSNKK